MNVDQIVSKFKEKPYLLEMGANKIAYQLKCSVEDVREAKKTIHNINKYGAEYHPNDVAFNDGYNHKLKVYPAGFKNPKESARIIPHKKQGAKILLFDLETSPLVAYVWGTRKQFIQDEQIIRDWSILTYAAKWLNEDKIISGSAYGNDDFDDFDIVSELWNLLDECNVLIAHNCNRFDKRKINARFLYRGLPTPSPYRVIDTLEIARQNFGTTYHKLDYLSKFIGSDGKMEHTGFKLWRDCMEGDKEAWDLMLEYNKKDVIELEKVYLELRSWDSRHPNIGIYNEKPDFACTKCGSHNLEYTKDIYTNTKVFKLYKCNDCNSWSRSRVGESKSKVLMTQ